MSEIAKAYDPKEVEEKWYAAWLSQGAFDAEADPQREPFCVMIPPPNVTGILHLGHILNNTLQDILTRRARLEGKSALWFPGADHAGLATQTRVEKKLRAEGKSRHEVGREAFLEKVRKWSDEHAAIIFRQLHKMGASCDWRRTSFTLDEGYARGVLAAFVKLFHRGFIYRGLRMSNWCPASQTALSNEEVIMKPQKGFLYRMRYEVVEQPGQYVEISTTRPETLMGDVAVAVHPDDERYADLVGQHVWRPFPRQQIPVIADRAVEKDFGTGALKVTPAHDALDFEIGQRHSLPILDVLNPDGTLNELAGEDFVGMERFEARKKAAAKLEELGLLVNKEPYENVVGFSERADVPIEPRLTMQWWLRYPKVNEAREVVQQGILRFHPKRWEKTYMHWLDTMERDGIDWCISRQIWWGHRIPVWYRKGVDRNTLDFSNPEHLHVSVDGPPDPENWEQDEDVLDTWASSWLWPLANLGWPEPDEKQTREIAYFYPTTVLVTGFDIIFLWVARMVIAGLEFHGEEKKELSPEDLAQRIPFRDVYMTGLIRDEKGRKMSKSLGNSPDPLDLIARYGADGVRFGIINIAPSGQDILYSEDRIEIGRNFCNKLWNACRFRQMSGVVEDNHELEEILRRIQPDQLTIADHWLIRRLLEITTAVGEAFDAYEMHRYPHLMYEFFWSDYCDWYVEVSKSRVAGGDASASTVLSLQDLALRQTLLLLHPIVPFITEELWNSLGYAGPDDHFLQDTRLTSREGIEQLMESVAGVTVDLDLARQFENVKELVTRMRALKATFKVASRRDLDMYYLADDATAEVLERNGPMIQTLAQCGSFFRVTGRPEGMPATVAGLATVYLDLADAVDVPAERERLRKELEKLDKGIQSGQAKLENERFISKAPAEVVEGAKAQLAETRARRDEVSELLRSLGG